MKRLRHKVSFLAKVPLHIFTPPRPFSVLSNRATRSHDKVLIELDIVVITLSENVFCNDAAVVCFSPGPKDLLSTTK